MVCGSDQGPLLTTLRLRFIPRGPSEKVKRFDVSRFGDEKSAQGFDKAMAAKYKQITYVAKFSRPNNFANLCKKKGAEIFATRTRMQL